MTVKAVVQWIRSQWEKADGKPIYRKVDPQTMLTASTREKYEAQLACYETYKKAQELFERAFDMDLQRAGIYSPETGTLHVSYKFGGLSFTVYEGPKEEKRNRAPSAGNDAILKLLKA